MGVLPGIGREMEVVQGLSFMAGQIAEGRPGNAACVVRAGLG